MDSRGLPRSRSAERDATDSVSSDEEGGTAAWWDTADAYEWMDRVGPWDVAVARGRSGSSGGHEEESDTHSHVSGSTVALPTPYAGPRSASPRSSEWRAGATAAAGGGGAGGGRREGGEGGGGEEVSPLSPGVRTGGAGISLDDYIGHMAGEEEEDELFDRESPVQAVEERRRPPSMRFGSPASSVRRLSPNSLDVRPRFSGADMRLPEWSQALGAPVRTLVARETDQGHSAVVQWPFSKTAEYMVSVDAQECVVVLGRSKRDPRWLVVRKEDGSEGEVPAEYVPFVDDDNEGDEVQPAPHV